MFLRNPIGGSRNGTFLKCTGPAYQADRQPLKVQGDGVRECEELSWC